MEPKIYIIQTTNHANEFEVDFKLHCFISHSPVRCDKYKDMCSNTAAIFLSSIVPQTGKIKYLIYYQVM